VADQLHLLRMGDLDREAGRGQTIVQPGPLQGRFHRHGHLTPELAEDGLQRLEVGREPPVLLDDLPFTGQPAQGEVSFVEIEAGVVHKSLRRVVARALMCGSCLHDFKCAPPSEALPFIRSG
jgi:hypothetical protein